MNRHLNHEHHIHKDSPAKGEAPPVVLPGALESFWMTGDHHASIFSQEPHGIAAFSKDLFRETLLRYIVQSAAPFNTVTQKSLQQLLVLAYKAPDISSIRLPSRITVTRDLKDLYERCKSHLAHQLQKQERISYTIDGWTTPNMKSSFLAITAHWIDNAWKQHAVTIGFEKITGVHTGQNMAQIMHNVLDQYQLTKIPFHITMDNASNMDKLATVLESRLQCPSVFKAQDNRVHCIGHIINLASQAALEAIRAESPVVEEDHELFDRAENNIARLECK